MYIFRMYNHHTLLTYHWFLLDRTSKPITRSDTMWAEIPSAAGHRDSLAIVHPVPLLSCEILMEMRRSLPSHSSEHRF